MNSTPREPVRKRTEYGLISLTPIDHGDNGWSLSFEKVANSYIDIDNPSYARNHYQFVPTSLVFELFPVDGDYSFVHIGAGMFGTSRILGTRFPRSKHVVMEPNQELLDLVNHYLPVEQDIQLSFYAGLGEHGIRELSDSSSNAVIADAFDENHQVPETFTQKDFLNQAQRVLKDDGLLTIHIADDTGLERSQECLRLARELLGYGYILGTSRALGRKHSRNLVFLVASKRELDRDQINECLATAGNPVYRVLDLDAS